MTLSAEDFGEIRLLTREEIRQADDLPKEIVKVPEWGNGDEKAAVIVQGMTGSERDSLESEMIEMKKNRAHINVQGYLSNFRAKLVSRTCVDQNGNRVFTDSDALWLGQKSAQALERVVDVAKKLSAMTNEDEEELTKNSSTDDESSTSISLAS
jgi:hypothetical protein